MKRMTLGIIALLAIGTLAFTSCEWGGNRADQVQQERSEQMFENANNEIGMPNIVNWQQKKTLKMIYELADQADLICYAYVQDQLKGQFHFIGRTAGYGIPFSAQFTNPEKIVKLWSEVVSLPQADPNNLFMPTSSDATWLILINPQTNKPEVVYMEPHIIVSAFPLTINVANLDEQNKILHGGEKGGKNNG